MTDTVLITGCSSGLGLATAHHFSDRGWNVVATSRNVGALRTWEEADRRRRLVLALDVTDEAQIEQAFAVAEAQFGAVLVLVNNAGYGLYGPLEAVTASELEAQLDTLVLGSARMIKRALPSMRARRRGTIVNVSSLGGRMAAPFMSAYCAAKFGLEGLSESLAYELAPHGVRVRIVEPFHFRTRFLEALRLARHPAYAENLDNHMGWVEHSLEKAHAPELAARAIYRAATARGARLRYVTHGRGLLALKSVLPWTWWMRLSGLSMYRPRPSLGK